MAIQLNERDHFIFSLIEEHKVLLEKHISWFIAQDKPVLIRDRLRKLFYLDYLICHKHASKLPWWTTPTKPLVYMLSSISKDLSATKSLDEEVDLFNPEVQRHFLEIANIRMLCLIAQKETQITNFTWKTSQSQSGILDAVISFQIDNKNRSVGIINYHSTDLDLSILKDALSQTNIDSIAIVSRDEKEQKFIQNNLAQNTYQLDLSKIFLVTHHELYKSGLAKAKWANATRQEVNLLNNSSPNNLPTATKPWSNPIINTRLA